MTNEEITIKLQQVDDRSKSNGKRLDEAEKKLEDNAAMLAMAAYYSDEELSSLDMGVDPSLDL